MSNNKPPIDITKFDLNALTHYIRRKNRDLKRPKYVRSGNIQVFFDDIEQALVEHIQKAQAVFGCVAWLTNEPILRALVGRQTSIIVQKEDFLRPDFFRGQKLAEIDYYNRIRELYEQLQCTIKPWDIEEMHGSSITRELGYCLAMDRDGAIQPIQCLGNKRRGKAQAEALLHHKFIVLCNIRVEPSIKQADFVFQIPEPYAVWTGSFNFSYNATRSLENGLLISDAEIAQAFFDEYLYWYPFAEPLDWENEWIDDFNIRGPRS